MSMVLFYERINWENYPSIVTPINEINLNKLDYAAKTLDERTVTLYNTKADLSELSSLFSDIENNEITGVITFKRYNGTTFLLDTKLEKLAINFSYDAENEQLVITLDDGTKQYVNMSALVTQYEFLDSDTIGFTLSDGKVTANVIDGSITEKKLQPNYLANIKVQAENSELSAKESTESAKESRSYAIGGTGTREGEDTDNAKYYAELAKENIEPVMNAVSDISLNRQTLGYVKKNLLKNTATTKTVNGVTFTVNDDGSVTVNGTSTGNVMIGNTVILPKGKYVLTGCAAGGSYNGYNQYMSVSESGFIGYDYGNGLEFELTETSTVTVYSCRTITVGTVFDNLTFYPMIRSADITDDTFEPYVDDVNTRLENIETEVTPIERGGTGSATAKEAQYNLLKDMTEETNVFTDEVDIPCVYITPSAEKGFLYRRSVLLLWNYIKGKISYILGLSATNYAGTSAMATADAEGNVITDTYALKSAMEWKLLKTVTGATAVSLADIEFNELMVTVQWGSEVYPFYIPKADLASTAKTYYNGKVSFQNSSTPYATEIRVTASLTQVYNSLSMANNGSWTRAGVTDACTTKVYYR